LGNADVTGVFHGWLLVARGTIESGSAGS